MDIKYNVSKYKDSKIQEIKDSISVEEPLEMRLRFKKNHKWETQNISITMRTPNNDKDLIDKFLNSEISKNCTSFQDLKIKETMPIIKNCDLYIGNDTGWLHISSALGIKCLALFMDSPVEAYGKYSKNINIIVPEGETEETTTHDTLGADKISLEKVFEKSIELLN